MAIRTLDVEDTIDNVWSELVYTEARLLKSGEAKDLAGDFGSMIKRCAKVKAGQQESWRGEIIAQAGVDAENDNLDDTTEEIADELFAAENKDRASPRFRRYFPKPPSDIIRLGLESQLEVVRPWAPSLRGEPEKELQALGARLEGNLTHGTAAVRERASAIAGTADHRVREIVRLIDDANALRRSTYGVLLQRGADKKLARDWPNRFFRRGTTARAKKAETQEKTETPKTPA